MQPALSALRVACLEGDEQRATQLLRQGAQKDHAAPNGSTPLLIACWAGHEACAQLLLEQGAAVDLAMQGGATPLYVAAFMGHEPAVRAYEKYCRRLVL